jgi:bifunctional ADP-heptose synthase (sugar kinase/adenylyltransferase)
VLLAGDDVPVTLVTALCDDDGANRLRELLADRVRLLIGPATGGTAVKCRIGVPGRTIVRTDRGDARPRRGFGRGIADELRAALAGAGALLVADYGRGVAADPAVRGTVAEAVERGLPVVWDPHPRGPAPVAGVRLATPNAAEAARAVDLPVAGPDVLARALRRAWSAAAVAVTLGSDGAVVADADGPAVAVRAPDVCGGDPCGAGDRFAGAAAAALARGSEPIDAVRAAVAAAAAFVGDGGAAAVRTAPKARTG